MDLQQAWNKLKEEKLSTATDKLLPAFVKHSKHPVQKLVKALQITLAFSIAFGIIFIGLFFVFDHWLIKFFLGLVIVAYVFFYVYNRRTYQQLKSEWDKGFETNLKNSLERIHHIVFSSIRFQEKAALIIYPISVTAGYLMGLYVGDDGGFEKDIRDSFVIGALVVAMAILTPASYYLTRWMYKVSYDKYLNQLKSLIQQIKEEEF